MDKKKKDCSYWIAVLLSGVALGSIAGFVFGWLWKEGPTSSEATKLVDVFIAIGTIASSAVALYFGLGAQRKESKERSLKARIFKTELEARFAAVKNRAALLKGAYSLLASSNANYVNKKTLNRMRQHLEHIVILFNDDFLEAFGRLHPENSFPLITELAAIKLIKVEFDLFESTSRINKASFKNKAEENRKKITQFENMVDTLLEAYKDQVRLS